MLKTREQIIRHINKHGRIDENDKITVYVGTKLYSGLDEEQLTDRIFEAIFNKESK